MEQITDETKGNLYCLPQPEVNRIEHILNGGDESDIDTDEEESGDSGNDNEDHFQQVICSTRSGRSATRLRL